MQKYKYSKNEKLSPLLTWNLRKIFGKIKAPPQKNRPIQQLSPLRLKTRFLASIGHRGCLSKSQIGRCRRLQSMPDPPHPFYRPRHQIIKSEKCARSPHHIIGDCHSSWLWIWWVQKKTEGGDTETFSEPCVMRESIVPVYHQSALQGTTCQLYNLFFLPFHLQRRC